MATVQAQILELIQRVDPAAEGGTTITAANLATNDPESFTKQDLLNYYNEARIVAYNAAVQVLPPMVRAKHLSGLITKATGQTFAAGVLNKPAGYLEAVLLTDVDANKITILPASTIEFSKHLDSVDNPLVYEEDTAFRSEHGNTYIPDDTDYILRYYGLVGWTVANITTDSPLPSETFNIGLQPLLLQLAEAICNEIGGAEVNALAKRLVERYKEGLV